MDDSSTYALYDEYILEEFLGIGYLTNRDINYISDEISSRHKETEEILNSLSTYIRLIENTMLQNSTTHLREAGNILYNHLANQDKRSNISKIVAAKSIIFSKDISTYLRYMGYVKEDRELTDLFYQKVDE